MTKAELKARGRAVMSLAKELRKKNPGKMWKQYVSEAGKMIKGTGQFELPLKEKKPVNKISLTKKYCK
ncbi:MAG: hypothetical protein GYA62_15335 [Bacteroidales bacterium]|nr:hypothetical protein [Bacteroidales bacterium]